MYNSVCSIPFIGKECHIQVLQKCQTVTATTKTQQWLQHTQEVMQDDTITASIISRDTENAPSLDPAMLMMTQESSTSQDGTSSHSLGSSQPSLDTTFVDDAIASGSLDTIQLPPLSQESFKDLSTVSTLETGVNHVANPKVQRWAATILIRNVKQQPQPWMTEREICNTLEALRKSNLILRAFCGRAHVSTTNASLHCHLFVCYTQAKRRAQHNKYFRCSWAQTFKQYNASSEGAYYKYALHGLPALWEYNPPISNVPISPVKKTQGALILEMVKSGVRLSEIIAEYPYQHQRVKALGYMRPPRTHLTKVLHIWGIAGVGKTYMIHKTLMAVQNMMPSMDYYMKLMGFNKYWDGYDNQPIVFVDDPVMPDVKVNKDDIQGLKLVMSTGACQVEIKYGSMQFDSKLIIVASNQSPELIAQRCGSDNSDAIFRRLTDTFGAHYIGNEHTASQIPALILTCILDIWPDFKIHDCYNGIDFGKYEKPSLYTFLASQD